MSARRSARAVRGRILRCCVTKQEVIFHCVDDKMPMQVRMLAEAVYGVGSMGQNGAMARKHMAQMERGGDGMHLSHMRMA